MGIVGSELCGRHASVPAELGLWRLPCAGVSPGLTCAPPPDRRPPPLPAPPATSAASGSARRSAPAGPVRPSPRMRLPRGGVAAARDRSSETQTGHCALRGGAQRQSAKTVRRSEASGSTASRWWTCGRRGGQVAPGRPPRRVGTTAAAGKAASGAASPVAPKEGATRKPPGSAGPGTAASFSKPQVQAPRNEMGTRGPNAGRP